MEAVAQVRPNGLGTGAMVTGIVALILALIPGIGILSALIGPVAMILGFVALRRKDLPSGKAKVGLATGALALVIAIGWIFYFENRGAAERTASANNEVTEEWLTGRWSAESGDCRPEVVLELKTDGSYTAPSTTPGRAAIGIWTIENRILQMGTVFQQERFTIRRVARDELTMLATGAAAPMTLHRC